MKSTERHKLKENDFARSVAAARDALSTRGTDITRALVAAVVVIALIAGYTLWRQSRNAKANAALASGLALFEAPVMPIAAPAPGSPLPVQQPGTFPTEQAKLEAALPKLVEAADAYPNTDAGIAARYYAASALAALGRFGEAEQQFQEVVDKAGNRIYSRTGRLGLADAKAAQKKYRTYVQAGRTDEAARAFSRIVDEFPQSVYAADARREREEARKG